MGQKQHTQHSMDLDDAPTSKRSRTQHNGPFRYEKMIPGRDESQVASMQVDPGQLVWCRENLYRQNAVFRVGKRYFTYTWDEAMEYVNNIPTGQRDYYEWVRAGTCCFAFLDVDAYSDTNQAKWADPEWIDAARREWYSKISTALINGFASLEITIEKADLQIGWGSRVDGDRYKHSYHVCVRSKETVVTDIRLLGPIMQRMWDAAGLDGTVFDKSVYSDGQQWKMCFGSKHKWEKREDGVYTGRKIHTSPMLPLDENGDVISQHFDADIWKRHSIQGGGEVLSPGKLDAIVEIPETKTRRIASKSAPSAMPAQRREATDGKTDLPIDDPIVKQLIDWANDHFDPAPNIIQAWKYAHVDGDVYVLRNDNPHCHICGELHDGSGALSNNKSYFNFTQRGCTFKMMGATCGEKIYPEVGRIHLPREIRELLGDDSVPHATPVELAAGDLGIAATYLRLFGADMKFIDAKGNAFMWNDEQRLWVESGPLFVRHQIAVTFQAEVNYHIAKSEMEMKDLDLERPWGEEAVARYAQLGETRSNMVKVGYKMEMASQTKGILEYLIPKLSDPGFMTSVNRSPHELPVQDGRILDLKTLETRPRVRSDLFSVELPVSYDPDPEIRANVTRFVEGVTTGDADLLRYMQRLLGYALTGEVSERSLFILWGVGCNGKSSIVNIMEAIMGPMFTAISESVMINRERRGGATPELIPLIAARLAVFSESESGAKLNSTRIKNLTGSDKISARQLYGKQITFRPQAKLFMMTNHLPDFDFRDRAMVDRVKLIPFKARFEVTPENTRFVDSLRKEHLSEVFSWIVEGSKLFYQSGMGEIPQCCIEQMQAYIDEEDNVARFIDAELESVGGSPAEKKKHRMERQYVHFLYTKYTEGEREDPVSKRVLYKQLADVFDTYKSNGKRYFTGCRAKPVDFDDEPMDFDDARPGSGGS